MTPRACSFKQYVPEKAQDGTHYINKPGLFHEWGMEAQEERDGNIMWSVGLIEDAEGKMHSIPVDKITFLV